MIGTPKLLAIAALASLAFTLTIQQQNAAAFNDRNNQFVYNTQNHLQISEDHGIASNSVNIWNDETLHTNDNYNSHRGETYEERYNLNTVDKPDNN
jgi:hypothetical protein